MSLDSAQLQVYKHEVFQARQQQSTFFAPPDYRIPVEGQITIIGTGSVDIVDSCGRPQQRDFGVYIKEHETDASSRLAFIYPDSIPISSIEGRSALEYLNKLLLKSMNSESAVFGLSASFNAVARKTQQHILKRQFSSIMTCHHFNMDWDLENNQLLLD